MTMATMSELDSTAGPERWSISTDWMLLIVPAVCAAGSLRRFPPRLGGKTHTGETFTTRATPAARSRTPTHVQVGARGAATRL
jgi:hypothetical protein